MRKGVPFRETHHVAGRAVQPAERSCKGRRVAAVHETQHGAHQVQLAEERSCALTELSVADLQSLHPLFGDDVSRSRSREEGGEAGRGGAREKWQSDAALRCTRHLGCTSAVSLACSYARCGTSLPCSRLARDLSSREEQVLAVWDFDASVERRDSIGGVSKRRVLEQADALAAWADAAA